LPRLGDLEGFRVDMMAIIKHNELKAGVKWVGGLLLLMVVVGQVATLLRLLQPWQLQQQQQQLGRVVCFVLWLILDNL